MNLNTASEGWNTVDTHPFTELCDKLEKHFGERPPERALDIIRKLRWCTVSGCMLGGVYVATNDYRDVYLIGSSRSEALASKPMYIEEAFERLLELL